MQAKAVLVDTQIWGRQPDCARQALQFWAPVPAEEKSSLYLSTVAYIATLLLYRYKVLGILDDEGRAIQSSGIIALPDAVQVIANETAPIKGKVCPICHSGAMIKREGYEFSRLAGIRGILLGIRLSTGSCSRSSDRSSPA
jgi:ribonucleoside-diphosphate reductase alpha chain